MATQRSLGAGTAWDAASEACSSGMVYVMDGPTNKAKLHALDQLEQPVHDASCAYGWDCVEAAAARLRPSTVQVLLERSNTCITLVTPSFKTAHCCRSVTLVRGTTLIQQGRAVGQMLLLLDGTASCERTPQANGNGPEQATFAHGGSVLGAASFLCSTGSRELVTAATTCHVLAICKHELQNLLEAAPSAYLDLLFAGSKALAYYIRKFVTLGLNRVWLRAGDVAYKQGEYAESMHVVISGRVRLVSQTRGSAELHVDEEVGRGETIGAVWAVTRGRHDTSAVAVRGCELVRLSKGSFEVISRTAPEAAARVLSDMANRMVCAHHSRNRSFQSVRRGVGGGGLNAPTYVAPPKRTGSLAMPGGATRSQQGEIATVAFVPVGGSPGTAGLPAASGQAVRKLVSALRKSLAKEEGSCMVLDWSMVKSMQAVAASRLQVPFYRTQLNSWMAAFEESNRFILLEADPAESKHWASLCIEQADCVLLVAAEGATCDVTAAEYETVWQQMMPEHSGGSTSGPSRPSSQLSRVPGQDEGGSQSKLCKMDMEALANMDYSTGAAFFAESDHDTDEGGTYDDIDGHSWLRCVRRVELVLLHADESAPADTLAWLRLRPYLTRHHHVRLACKADISRLRRWVSGKAVGLVLSGGGSRGLAHLGVLQAINEVGVPIDVVGGTSQGAFMGALFAQGLSQEQLRTRVRSYAGQMSSPRHLLSDVTLPILSLFSGRQFDRVMKETFSAGAQAIEDLWLPFFCVSTNLSKSQLQVHQLGPLWQLVRASMTIVGMVPPVIRDGDMLVDGGYLNNMPVDIMHGLGVRTVIVVDVEDKQSSVWHSLTPYDGGLSGWRLLWDRLCPVPSLRFGGAAPRYRELVNVLSWIAHTQNLRRMCQDYRVDLYLRPPGIGSYKLMDFHLLDRIVRPSYLKARSTLQEWMQQVAPRLGNTHRFRPHRHQSIDSPNQRRVQSASLDGPRQWGSVACMTQLHGKHAGQSGQMDAAVPEQHHAAYLVRAPPSQARRGTVDGTASLPMVTLSQAAPKPMSAASHSGDSLADAQLPTPGEAVKVMQSEIMRLTARAQRAAKQVAAEDAAAEAASVAAAEAPADAATARQAATADAAAASAHVVRDSEQRAPDSGLTPAEPSGEAARLSGSGRVTDDVEAAAQIDRVAGPSSTDGEAPSAARGSWDTDITQLPGLLPSLAVFEQQDTPPVATPARRSREDRHGRDDGTSDGADGIPRRRTSRSAGSSWLQTIEEADSYEPEDLGC